MKELRPCPKPERPMRGGAEAERYMRDVRSLGCILCGNAVEVEVHHPIERRFSQRKASDMEAYALCPAHHRLRHSSPDTFQTLYGFEADLVAQTKAAVERMRKLTIGRR